MKNSLRIHKWTHNEFNIFILGVLTHPHLFPFQKGFTLLLFLYSPAKPIRSAWTSIGRSGASMNGK